jgi:hypothetical protein
LVQVTGNNAAWIESAAAVGLFCQTVVRRHASCSALILLRIFWVFRFAKIGRTTPGTTGARSGLALFRQNVAASPWGCWLARDAEVRTALHAADRPRWLCSAKAMPEALPKVGTLRTRFPDGFVSPK